ncbi:hypothetical protein [Enterococcus sp. LJL90]
MCELFDEFVNYSEDDSTLYFVYGRTYSEFENEPLKFFSAATLALSFEPAPKGKYFHDFMVVFNEKKPEVADHPKLLELARWTDYGSMLYRVKTLISKQELFQAVAEEFSLTSEDFLVSGTKLDSRFIDI